MEWKPQVTGECYASSFCLAVCLFIYNCEEPFAEWFLMLQAEFGSAGSYLLISSFLC